MDKALLLPFLLTMLLELKFKELTKNRGCLKQQPFSLKCFLPRYFVFCPGVSKKWPIVSFLATITNWKLQFWYVQDCFFVIFTIDKRSVYRYNLSMTFLDLLADKKTTVYSLSIDSGVPKTTLTDIASGKTDILECSGKTLLAISKCLNVSIEDLFSLEREEAKTLLPVFLIDSINEYRKAVRKDSTLIDCYSDQLNSSINVAEVEHLISKEQADRLRTRYFYKKNFL